MPQVLEYKCPNCGGGIAFSSEAQQMQCPYCETEFLAEALEQFNQVLEQRPVEETVWEESAAPWDDTNLRGYLCPSCGGALVGDGTTAATRCPYCGNPAVLPDRLEGIFRPDSVIPFQLDKQAAVRAFAENLKGKRLLPKSFRNESKLGEITGVYVPFWLFDCEAGASMSFRATRTHHWSDHHYTYTKTDHYQVRRAGNAAFERIPADGSQKMDDAYMEALEPYDYRGLRPFQMTYLSGYLADRYDVSAEESRPRVTDRVQDSMEQMLRGTVGGYASLAPEEKNAWLHSAKASCALLPVWTLHAEYKGKTYHFAMNGQTGKFIGELPCDKGRAAAWFCGLFFGIASIGTVLAFLLGGVPA
jgi:DNA-directed RNA polymerase subunit RPC12/RpoP